MILIFGTFFVIVSGHLAENILDSNSQQLNYVGIFCMKTIIFSVEIVVAAVVMEWGERQSERR